MKPGLRLGAGPPDDPETSFEALKAHPFFKGINFSLLAQTAPPLPHYGFKQYIEAEHDAKYTPIPLKEVMRIGPGDQEDLDMIISQQPK